jgi:hypothetical protein
MWDTKVEDGVRLACPKGQWQEPSRIRGQRSASRLQFCLGILWCGSGRPYKHTSLAQEDGLILPF